jgi:protein-S-isoprenylcysteine O-methyltransferase Ste14
VTLPGRLVVTSVTLSLYVAAVLVLFGVRSVVHRRRTGHSGFHGISGTPREAGWWGGIRAVEAPYLLRVHGPAYAAYAARTGRFLPGVGRLSIPTPAEGIRA